MQIFTLKNRIIIDSLLFFIFLFNFGLLFTGEVAHVIIGVWGCVLLSIHIYAGRAWFLSLVKNKIAVKQWVPLVLNFVLFFALCCLFLSGFALLLINSSGMFARQLHTASAYWVLLLMGVHVGLYWDRVRVVMFPLRKIFHTLFFILANIIALYGVYACFEIELFRKLFQSRTFEFWDETQPTVLFFFLRFSLFCLSAVFVRYYLFIFGKRKRR